MAGHLMVLNPAKKKRRKHKRKAGRRRRKLTAAQLAAGFGGKSKRRKISRKRRGKAKVVIVESNPTREGRMARKHRRRHRRHHTRKALRRRFRRNPIEGGFIGNTIAPAAIGAAGAVAVDFLQGMIPLNVQSAVLQPVVGIGYALLVGLGVDAVAGSKAGGEAAAGGIVVQLYNLFNSMIGGGAGMAGGSPGYGGYGGGYGQAGYGQMNRYMGYLRRNPRMLAAINQRRALKGLQPVNIRPRHGLARNPMAIGVLPLNPRYGLGATSPNVASRMRIGRGGLGWMSPARNLNRYMR